MHQSNLLLDQAPPDRYIFVVGMGRSGTTWLSQIINSSRDYRILFEPFLAARTPEAQAFRYCQYVAPGTSDEVLESAARAILAGKVSNSWIDRDNLPGTYRKRLVKDIRCNLMLGWLAELSSRPIVLIIRHPLQVAHSWLRLGWGKEADGSQDVFDLIVSQSPLLEDFPLIKQIAPTIAQADFYLRIVFLWCVFHYVPRHHLRAGQAHVVFYESLLQNRLEPLESLFEFLKIEFDQEGVERV
ncbi:hypothetical protein GC197_18370, partial [bacterium]|nr:hypothetical protein [bacterium]